jgi:hypothetical protein
MCFSNSDPPWNADMMADTAATTSIPDIVGAAGSFVCLDDAETAGEPSVDRDDNGCTEWWT